MRQYLNDDVVTRRLVRALLIALLVAVILAVLAMVAAVFDRVHNTLVVAIFSVLFAYVVYPPIKWLAVRRVPIAIAALIVYAVLAVAVLGAIAWLSPAIAAQGEALTREFPKIVAQTQDQIAHPSNSPLLARLPASARDAIATNAGKAGTLIGSLAGGVGANAVAILAGTTATLVNVGLTLGLTLLLVSDLASVQSFGIRLVSRRYRPAVTAFMSDVNAVIGGFVRGQVLLALGVGVAGTIILIIVGVPYAILLGLLAGIVSIVPLIGMFVALLPVLVISFFTVGLLKTIVVGVLYAVLLFVQQNVFTPIVNSRAVGVTPLVVFLALLFGSEAFGILGALLAIPVAGILRVAAERLFPHDADSTAVLIAARGKAGEPVIETEKALRES
jgi:predicted PurR-regulated permease PerM